MVALVGVPTEAVVACLALVMATVMKMGRATVTALLMALVMAVAINLATAPLAGRAVAAERAMQMPPTWPVARATALEIPMNAEKGVFPEIPMNAEEGVLPGLAHHRIQRKPSSAQHQLGDFQRPRPFEACQQDHCVCHQEAGLAWQLGTEHQGSMGGLQMPPLREKVGAGNPAPQKHLAPCLGRGRQRSRGGQ